MRFALRQAGVDVQETGRLACLPPPLTALEEAFDPAVLVAIAAEPHLLVTIDRTRVDPLTLVAAAGRAWPDLRAAVAVQGKRQARDSLNRLRQLGTEAIGSDRLPGSTVLPPRISVATFQRLRMGAVNLKRVDLLVFPSALDAVTAEARRLVDEAPHARLLGFAGVNDVWTGGNRDARLELFGVARLTVLTHGTAVRPVHVVACPFERSGASCQGFAAEELYRQAVWTNRGRNRFVAELARGCATGGIQATQVRQFLAGLGFQWRRVRAVPVPPKRTSRTMSPTRRRSSKPS